MRLVIFLCPTLFLIRYMCLVQRYFKFDATKSNSNNYLPALLCNTACPKHASDSPTLIRYLF
ncbi:hypothetical protein BKA67DRAFT_543607 [Truncatella angustata]|uniref:Uncharacterized protein n=1 Tax=Truncatella angustata TaxID=152316 RepID=A0A9P9A2H0_9PEZI|nr:uncharacterized protein BKA67DRAFT_543607 [Truncatella angustata]KAH6659118.1 hypothetical protein BKA67DRAFT_543607 [Truncatella angustata]